MTQSWTEEVQSPCIHFHLFVQMRRLRNFASPIQNEKLLERFLLSCIYTFIKQNKKQKMKQNHIITTIIIEECPIHGDIASSRFHNLPDAYSLFLNFRVLKHIQTMITLRWLNPGLYFGFPNTRNQYFSHPKMDRSQHWMESR